MTKWAGSPSFVKPRTGSAWRRCVYCGRFISNADMDSKRAGCNFTPDTAFSSESVEWFHVACKS